MLRRSNNPVLPRLSAVEILLLNGFGHRAKGGCTAFTELSLPPTCIDTNHKNESTKCSLQKKNRPWPFLWVECIVYQGKMG